jgi:nucleotide-binding universal stress UspA family protein
MFYKKILHATDLQGDHFKLCEKVAAFAKLHQAELYLIHVIEIPGSLLIAQTLGFTELVAPAKEDAKAVLKTVAEAIHISTQHTIVKFGSVKQHVTETAVKLQCDLIIIGSHSTHELSDMLGTTAWHISQHAPCDVLMIR